MVKIWMSFSWYQMVTPTTSLCTVHRWAVSIGYCGSDVFIIIVTCLLTVMLTIALPHSRNCRLKVSFVSQYFIVDSVSFLGKESGRSFITPSPYSFYQFAGFVAAVSSVPVCNLRWSNRITSLVSLLALVLVGGCWCGWGCWFWLQDWRTFSSSWKGVLPR